MTPIQPDADGKYRFTMLLGVKHLSVPTGEYVQDPDGYWRQIYTDSYTQLPDGSIVDVQPFEAPIRLGFDPRPYAHLVHRK